jgi:hypothetical protein
MFLRGRFKQRSDLANKIRCNGLGKRLHSEFRSKGHRPRRVFQNINKTFLSYSSKGGNLEMVMA